MADKKGKTKRRKKVLSEKEREAAKEMKRLAALERKREAEKKDKIKKEGKVVGNRKHVDMEYRELVAHGSDQFPIEVNEYSSEPYKEYGMHWHEEMEVVYVRKGAIFFLINKEEIVHAQKGDLVIIPPNAKHSLWSDESTGVVLEITSMLFNPKMLSTEMNDTCQRVLSPIIVGAVAFKYLVKKDADGYDLITDCFFDICSCYEEDNAFSLVRIKGKLFELMYYLLNLKVTYGKAKTKTRVVMAKTYEFIQLNYMNKINVMQLVELFNYSEPYFMKVFKDHFGIPFSKYVNSVRLEKGRELILSTKFSVDAIAKEVGFSSSGYFIRLFKKKYNKSPGQYREEYKAEEMTDSENTAVSDEKSDIFKETDED